MGGETVFRGVEALDRTHIDKPPRAAAAVQRQGSEQGADPRQIGAQGAFDGPHLRFAREPRQGSLPDGAQHRGQSARAAHQPAKPLQFLRQRRLVESGSFDGQVRVDSLQRQGYRSRQPVREILE